MPEQNENPSYTTNEIWANGEKYDHMTTYANYEIGHGGKHSLNAYYTGKIGGFGIDLNTDYLYSFENKRISYNEESERFDTRDFSTYSPIANHLWAAKLVVSHDLLGGNLQFGAEYTRTHRDDDYICEPAYINTTYTTLKQNKVAPFLSYTRITPIGKLEAGVRFEHVDFNYYVNHAFVAEQSRTYNDIFPSISLGTQIGKVQAQLSYTAKTHRPSYSSLRSNVSYVNRFTYETGNPALKDELIHDVTLQGMWRFVQFMFSFKHHTDADFYWIEQLPSNQAISVISHKNIKSLNDFTAYIAAAPKIGIWNPQWSVGLMKQWFTLNTQMGTYKMNSPIVTAEWNNAFRLSDTFTTNADLNFQSEGNTNNVQLTRNYCVFNVSFTKTFCNNRLSLILKGEDLFHSQRDANTLYNPQMSFTVDNTYDSQAVSLTLRYKFNVSKSKYKGTGAGQDEMNRL